MRDFCRSKSFWDKELSSKCGLETAIFSLRREQMLNAQASLRRLQIANGHVRLRLHPRTDGAERMMMGDALAGARAIAVTAREIFGGETAPGAGLILHRESALLARGEDVVLGEAGLA